MNATTGGLSAIAAVRIGLVGWPVSFALWPLPLNAVQNIRSGTKTDRSRTTAPPLLWYSGGLMTRSELITRLVQHQPRLTAQDAAACVDESLGAIVSQLGASERVEIRGFGSFAVGMRAPRIGRKPKTGDKVAVPAKWTVRFKAGMELRERVDRG